MPRTWVQIQFQEATKPSLPGTQNHKSQGERQTAGDG